MNTSTRAGISLRTLGALGLAIALTACGGKADKAGSTGPATGGKPPFDQEAVKALIAATAVGDTESCGIEGAATVGDAMRLQRVMMEQDGGAEESFTCRPSELADGAWECTWEVMQRTPGAADPDDPCAGGGSAFQAITRVGADGILVPGQLGCIAPG